MVKLTNAVNDNILVADMKDGQLAVITDWTIKDYVGMVVQRHGNSLIAVGVREGKSWPGLMGTSRATLRDCLVRVLRDGETLVVDKNQ